MEDTESLQQYQWHSMEVGEVISKLETDVKNGLTDDEVRKRLLRFGLNEIERVKRESPIVIFLRQFKNVLILLLIAATIISILLGEFVDSILILAIVMIAAILGFTQEYRAEKALEALKKMLSPKAKVVRNGLEVEVPTKELVPGDIVLLSSGDKVPADCRIVESYNLKVDEAPLTGESVPVEKDARPSPPNASISERRCMLYAGTTVVYGRARCVVTSTGTSTEIGKIAKIVSVIKKEETPLEKRMKEIARILLKITILIVAVIGIFGVIEEFMVHGSITTKFVVEMLVFSTALAVAVVPEALPAVVTGTLAIGMYTMAKQNALVRRMSAVETLGCTQVICTDKTGTLTKGEMTVREIYIDGRFISVTGVGYEPKGYFLESGKMIEVDERIKFLLTACVLCNDATLTIEDNRWVVKGDTTEGALIVLARKAGLDENIIRDSWKRVDEIPFSPERKMMTTINKSEDSQLIAFTKGAVEAVLDICSHVMLEGEVTPLDEGMKSKIMSVSDGMASRGLRVLAVAYKRLDSDYNISNVESNLIFLGLVGMIDPPREDAIEAIDRCKRIQIKPIMITGDHKLTAISIAKDMGIYKEGDVVLTSKELETMDEEELKKIVENVTVYARVSPLDKLKIVKAWKERGKVVAMTGDGVNDAPALKQADIGVAMGVTGTDVAKEVADMVLADDNFATIVRAIEYGRWIYDNIKKTLIYLLESNIVEVIVIAVLVLLGYHIPLLPIHLLYINIATDGFPAIALAFSPKDPDIMLRPPRDPKESIFSREVRFLLTLIPLIHAPIFITIFLLNIHKGIEHARTVLFLSFIVVEIVLALNLRSIRYSITKVRPHKWLVLSAIWEFFLLSLIISVDWIGSIFKLSKIGVLDILTICLVGLIPLLELEIIKRVAPNRLLTDTELQQLYIQNRQ